MTNKIFTALLLMFFLAACQPAENKIPEGLEAQRKMLTAKRSEMNKLNAFISKLDSAVQANDPAAQVDKRRLVETMVVKRSDFKQFVEIQGTVAADDMVGATAETSGRVVQLTVKEGDYVRKGKLIAKLDLEAMERQIAEVDTRLELAKTTFERQERLWQQNIGSEIQYLQAKNAKESLEKSLETMRFQLTKANVYAPVSGEVHQVMVQGGEIASPGMPIVMILNTAKLKVAADVPEKYLGTVKRGERVNISIPALDMKQQGRVSLIGATIDPSNRTFKVEASVSDPKKVLKPNLLATMLVENYTADNVVTLPVDIIQQDVSGKSFVFLIEPGAERAKKVFVTTGENYNGEIVITDGLTGGEQVITKGNRGLVDQEEVNIANKTKTTTQNG